LQRPAMTSRRFNGGASLLIVQTYSRAATSCNNRSASTGDLARRRMLWHSRPGAGPAPRSARITSFSRRPFMRRFILLAGAAVATLAAAIAHAQQPVARVQVGILECRGGASIGFIVGSVTNLGCVLRVDGMPEDRYIATIRKVGIDLGIT